jgi:hypothetical protein
MNNIIERKIADGRVLTGVGRRFMPVPYREMSDGCNKMQPRVILDNDPILATSAQWTHDTASARMR